MRIARLFCIPVCRTRFLYGIFLLFAVAASAQIPATTNVLKGDGSGGAADSGIAPADVVTLTGTQTLTSKTVSGPSLIGNRTGSFTTGDAYATSLLAMQDNCFGVICSLTFGATYSGGIESQLLPQVDVTQVPGYFTTGLAGSYSQLADVRSGANLWQKSQNIAGGLPFIREYNQTRRTAENGAAGENFNPFWFSYVQTLGRNNYVLGDRDNASVMNYSVLQAGGQLGAVHGGNIYNTAKGDAVVNSYNVWCSGQSFGDEEGCEWLRGGIQARALRLQATLNAQPSLDGTYNAYKMTGTFANGYLLGQWNRIINVSKVYSLGNVATIDQCPDPYGFMYCVNGDTTANWINHFGTSNVTFVSGVENPVTHTIETTIPGPAVQHEAPYTQVARTVVVPDSAGFTVGKAMWSNQSEGDLELIDITAVPDSTHISILTRMAHQVTGALVTQGGAMGNVFAFQADIVPANQLQNYFGGLENNPTDIMRVQRTVVGSTADGKLMLFDPRDAAPQTIGLNNVNSITSVPLTVTQSGGVITSISYGASTGNVYSPLTVNTARFAPPVPTITITGCTGTPATAVVPGYINANNATSLTAPIITNGGSGCDSATATLQNTFPNPYVLYPMGQIINVLTDIGGGVYQYGSKAGSVWTEFADVSKWQDGDSVRDVLTENNQVTREYSHYANYMHRGNPGAFSYLRLSGMDNAAFEWENDENMSNFMSFKQTAPADIYRGYRASQPLIKAPGIWSFGLWMNSPSPSGNAAGSLIYAGCVLALNHGTYDCSKRDDFNIFGADGVGTSTLLTWSPTTNTYHWDNASKAFFQFQHLYVGPTVEYQNGNASGPQGQTAPFATSAAFAASGASNQPVVAEFRGVNGAHLQSEIDFTALNGATTATTQVLGIGTDRDAASKGTWYVRNYINGSYPLFVDEGNDFSFGGSNLTKASFQLSGLELAHVFSGFGSNHIADLILATNASESSGAQLGNFFFAQPVSGKSGVAPGIKAGITSTTYGSGGSEGGYGGYLAFWARPDASSSFPEVMRLYQGLCVGCTTDPGFGNLKTNGAVISKVNAATFSATPTFSVSGNANRLLLTGNVTSSTIGAGADGQRMCMNIVQDATGGHSFVWPTNMAGTMTVGTTPSKRNQQCFVYYTADSLWVAESPGVINQ